MGCSRSGWLAGAAVLALAGAARAEEAPPPKEVSEVVVTASTLDLTGKAVTSSEGAVTKQELELRPIYRVGQLLETVPGLVVTVHSGEGKANQYLLRGFNLDHGTDLATYVDGMPVNERTHAHGQGYTDLNFIIPELAQGVRFTKGPYYASEGDFASVGSDRMALVGDLATSVTISAGTLHDERIYGGTTIDLAGDDRLIVAAEGVHLDGPWDHPDNLRKTNVALRYVGDGWAVTGLYYRGLWSATTDQPNRAIEQGLIGPYGTLDPTDGGQAQRYSLSASAQKRVGGGELTANAYAIRSQLTLWNNFTHFLEDPVNGDQHGQNDRRTTLGGEAAWRTARTLFGIDADLAAGVQGRFDDIYVDARTTVARRATGLLLADNVTEKNLGVWGETTLRFTPRVRAVAGLRWDHFWGEDENLAGGVSGEQDAGLVQPKGSLIFGPWKRTELYVSAGRGFHSNDVRAGTLTDVGAVVRPPFLVKSTGYEVGVRTTAIPHLQMAATLFQMSFDSELTYNADAGQTEAGRPGRRRGLELTAQYRPARWIELSANVAVTKARYTDGDPAGSHIEDAPAFVGSLGMLVDNLGPWSGALEFRDLGPHALTPDNAHRSDGYRELNMNVGYKLTPKLKVELDVFNVTDSQDDAAAYFYTDRLPGEPAEGVEDVHRHPLEPRSARLAVTATF